MKIVDAIGDPCPVPVVKTREAIKSLVSGDIVETLVDNEIAVQNLTKMAKQRNYGVTSEKYDDDRYRVIITVGDDPAEEGSGSAEETECSCDAGEKKHKNVVVAVTSSVMGTGDDELGGILIKGFIYALAQQDELPSAVIFYNGGAKLPCEHEEIIGDLRSMQDQGVEIMTCGTCLNHYGLTDKLKVGSVSNMYDIVERLTKADLVIRP